MAMPTHPDGKLGAVAHVTALQALILTRCGFRATHPRHTVAQQSLAVSIDRQQHDPQQLVRCADALYHPTDEYSACKG
jgi:hypothetical protein